jgi:hypothetical protein
VLFLVYVAVVLCALPIAHGQTVKDWLSPPPAFDLSDGAADAESNSGARYVDDFAGTSRTRRSKRLRWRRRKKKKASGTDISKKARTISKKARTTQR